MDAAAALKGLLALAFVLGLILLLAWAARRFELGARLGAGGRGERLHVVEVRPIDARRRLVLVRRDDVEHLLLIAQEGSVVVETNLTAGRAGEARRPPLAVHEREA